MKDKEMCIYERIHHDMIEHRHEGYDYWHYAFRIHKKDNEIELPPSHIRANSEKGHIFHCFDITIENIREVAKIKCLSLEDEYLDYVEDYIKEEISRAAKNRDEIIEQAIVQSNKLYDEDMRTREEDLKNAVTIRNILNNLRNEKEDDISLYKKGKSYYEIESYEEAIECFDRVLKLNPECISAMYIKGLALSEIDRCEDAIECLDKVLQIKNLDAHVLRKKAMILNRLQRFDESIECLNKALEIEPNNALTIFTKATTLMFLEDEECADKYFDKAVKLNPEYTKERVMALLNDVIEKNKKQEQ